MKTLPLFLLLAVAACTQPQRLVRFHAAGPDALDAVVHTLIENGHEPAEVDQAKGVVHTAWVDTGFMYGQIRNKTATIHRRYTALITPGAGGSDVTLRVDTKRCTPPEAVVTTTTTVQPATGTTVSVGNASVTFGGDPAHAQTVQQVSNVTQPCEPMDDVVEDHQAALDALGEKLRAALGGAASNG